MEIGMHLTIAVEIIGDLPFDDFAQRRIFQGQLLQWSNQRGGTVPQLLYAFRNQIDENIRIRNNLTRFIQ